MSKWVLQKAAEFCASVRDGTHDSPKSVEGGGKPLVTSKVVKQGVVRVEDAYLISEKDYQKINERSKVDRWDILMTMIGTVGECAIVKDDPDYAIKNIALFKMAGDEEKAKWLYYYLTSPTGQGALRGNFRGSSQQYISLDQLRNLEIPVPEKNVRSQIVAILSDYDSAIDNARRQIALLEEAAMRLYREWFRDGKGEKASLSEFVEITTGGSWGTDTKTVKTPNEVICIRGADFEEIHGRSLGKQIRRFISDKHLVERSLKDGDLVVEMSGGSPTQSTGRVVSISDMFLARYGVPVLATNFCKVIRPKSGYSHFLYLAWRDLYVSRIMFNYEVGTTGIKNFDYDLFVSDVEVSNPLPKLTQFNGLVDGMFSSMDMLGSLVQDLTEARDRLLPKLMSGEIEV